MKKILTLAIAALLSTSAQAGYTQYNLRDPDVGISGFFIQHDDDKSIAVYNIFTHTKDNKVSPATFVAQDSYANILSAERHYANPSRVPTSFSVFTSLTGLYYQMVDIQVAASGLDNVFNFAATYTQTLLPGATPTGPTAEGSTTYIGSVTTAAVSAEDAAYLDSLGGYADTIYNITPTIIGMPGDMGEVPEPASIALMMGGLMGLGFMRRRKQ